METVPVSALTDACGLLFTEGGEPPPSPIGINQGGQEIHFQKRERLPLLNSSVYTLTHLQVSWVKLYPNRRCHSSDPVPRNATLFGNRVPADVVS